MFCLSHLLEYRENILPPHLGNLPLFLSRLRLAATLITLLARALVLLDYGLGLRLDSLGFAATLISLGTVTDRVCCDRTLRIRTKIQERLGTHDFISGIHSCCCLDLMLSIENLCENHQFLLFINTRFSVHPFATPSESYFHKNIHI